MRKLILIFFLFTIARSPAQLLWQFNKDTVITWHYQFGDEFASNSLDTTSWDYSYGWARSIFGNKEQQYYSDGDNHRLGQGLLNLTAEKRPVQKKVVDWMPEADSIFDNGKFNGLNQRSFNYVAGLIQSKANFQYGYFEIKFRMPAQKGYWPAFWLYGGLPNEEIDMMELKTEKNNKLHVGRHSSKSTENYLRDGFTKKAWGEWVRVKGDLTAGYHVVAGEWTKDYIKYYLNGECIAYTRLGLNCPKKLVANIAVPANNGPFKPGPADTSSHSGDFEIDYIRVWTQEDKINNKHLVVAADSLEYGRNIDQTELRSKRRFVYGKKSSHKNEGITVSLMRETNNDYRLMVLGRNIPADAQFKISSLGNKELLAGKLAYGISKLSLPGPGPWKIELSAFGHHELFQLNPLRTIQN